MASLPAPNTAPAPVSPKRGLVYSLIAHAFWGLMPLYLLLVHDVPPLEFVAWRLVFTLPLCLIALFYTNGLAELRAVLRDRRAMLTLLGTAALIGFNWFVYVQAIQTGHVYAASLGYYILPLTMMLLGLVFLGWAWGHWRGARSAPCGSAWCWASASGSMDCCAKPCRPGQSWG